MDFSNLGTNAVIIKDAYKQYGSGVVVLKGLNMTVKKGSIYGLLGPSGCGKTTLLSCLVGRNKLDSGSIKLIISKKNEFGYMPQDLALYLELSIWETFSYFGKLFEMSEEILKIKSEKLKDLLQLPSLKILLSQLSGGQQRRVSLAVTMLHDPQLLILDEPTVGLDPVLSETLWAQLLDLSNNEGKTIILTTHYIEEANRAHCIGLMRQGVLLDEDSPSNVILKNHCTSLEDTFLKLSIYQQPQDQNCVSLSKNYDNCKPLFEDQSILKVHRVTSQLLKQYYYIKRNVRSFLFMVVLPAVIMVIHNYTIGHALKNIPVAIVNQEISFSDCQNKSYNDECSVDFLSCRYIDEFKNHNTQPIGYESLEEANKAMKKNEVRATLEFVSNFSGSLWERIQIGKNIDRMTEINSNIQVTMDMSDFVTAASLHFEIRESYTKFIGHLLNSCNYSEKIMDIPMSFQPPIYGSQKFNFKHASMPVMLIFSSFYLSFMCTASAIVMEKKEGLLERSIVSGVTLMEALFCHIVIQIGMVSAQLTIMLFIEFHLFKYPTNSSLILPILLLILQGLSGTFFGLTAGFLCDTEMLATLLGVGTMVPQLCICGLLWPVEGMHPILQAASIWSPLTMPVESLRMMFVKNWGITHFTVCKGFISSLCWIIGFIFLTIVGLRFKGGLRPNK